MSIQLEVYQIFLILVTLIGSVVGMIKIIGKQVNQNITQNFQSTNEKIESTNAKLEEAARQAAKGQEDLRRLEREFYQFQINMPHHYVARDDYIRGQSVIEAKLDAQYEQIKTVQIQQGVRRG